MATKLEKAKRKRQTFRGLFTKLEKKISNYLVAEIIDLDELKVMEQQLDEKQAQLERINKDIENLIETLEDLESDIELSEEYSDKLIRIKIKLKSVIESKQSGSSLIFANEGKDTKSDVSLKLPKFDLPSFNGDLAEWLSFKQIFKTTIHDCASLTNMQKLQYLKSALTGPASRLTKGFPITEASYKEAWATLISRYDNKKDLAYAELNKFFNSKPVKPDSRRSILDLLDSSNEAIRNLKGLKFELNSFVELILVYLIQGKFDTNLRRQWELSSEGDSIPTYDQIINFLEKQARSLQDANEFGLKMDCKQRGGVKKSVTNAGVTNVEKTQTKLCPACKEAHLLHKCSQFLKKNVSERWDFVKTQKLCVNCLRSNHFVSKCLITSKCKVCGKKHHSLLHSESSNCSTSQPPTQDSINPLVTNETPVTNETQVTTNTSCLASTQTHCNTLLSTALINVKSHNGNFITCRAMIDCGSQNTLISKVCCQRLGLPMNFTNHRIFGLNNVVAETSLYKVNLVFTPYFNNEQFLVDALVVSNVTVNLPNFILNRTRWPHIEGLKLADPYFHVSTPIDILIGADLFPFIILGQSILGPNGSPSAINSKLGWLLSGVIFSKNPVLRHNENSITCHAAVQLNQDLQKFWEFESLPDTSISAPGAEQLYMKSVTRNDSGRYVVELPFKEPPILGNSESSALKRFYQLEIRLQKNPVLKNQYHEFMQEYLDLKHMELVSAPDPSSNPDYFYLPHHAVLKDSTTTKLRVVFDGSAVGSLGKSLNDFLETGPKLQPDLFKILVKFRCYTVALTADIAKMYRQILVNPKHVDFQRIFWRFNPREPVRSYRLLTVTYGTACAPFLAIRTLRQLSDDYSSFPKASRVINENFYVDDLLAGTQSVEEAETLIKELVYVLNEGGFTLRKWASNYSLALKDIPDQLRSSSSRVYLHKDQSLKLLGLIWNTSRDLLQINIVPVKSVNTKRELLSAISRIFDPLGILSPTTIVLKILMQELWKENLSWDDPIPSSTLRVWNEFSSQIDLLKSVCISRRLIVPITSMVRTQLHGFCDGSGKAHASVIYLRTISCTNEITTNFVAAKTRVNPIKHITSPRIELCAAVLLAQLCATILEAVPTMAEEVYLWSDSEIVLNWIHSPPSKGNQFVTNRTSKIKSLVPTATWSHISGSNNPADCASRGILPKRLLNHNNWFNGPVWLFSNQITFPSFNPQGTPPPLAEVSSNVSLTPQSTLPNFLLKFSSYLKLYRVIAFCRRFIHNCKHPSARLIGVLSSKELDDSIKCLVKAIQENEFSAELKLLKKKQSLPSRGKYISLNIFLDFEGIMRVGGRLSQHQSLNQDQKHPVLLPKNNLITDLIITHYHLKTFHGGPQLVLSLIRQRYWFVDGRSTVRKIINRCLLCKRLKAKTCQQLMGNLPKHRITPTRPFSKTGLDFAGPFLTKPNLPRSKVRLKSYICVFICMCTKAVHLEAVSDLSSQALLAAFKRFISRRGLPSDMFSDNGKNFRGLANQFQELFKILKSDELQDFAASQLITWHFIPPYSPHFGGLWESAVKLTKSHLIKACKSTLLNFEELATLLCQIEACINSRPLIPMSPDPTDARALTPGHFLIGAPLLEIPESSPSATLKLSSRWQLVQETKRQFWIRWSRDYLHHLQQRPKWCSLKADVKVDDLVIIHDPQSSPLQWKLGRVTQVFPGPDGKIRVLNIRTNSGIIKRPITKVTVLLAGREDVAF